MLLYVYVCMFPFDRSIRFAVVAFDDRKQANAR